MCDFVGQALRPSLTHIIPPGHGDRGVNHVSSLNDQLFVIRHTDQIEIYNTSTFQLLRHITVPEVTLRVFGLTVSPTDNCTTEPVASMNCNYEIVGIVIKQL